MTEAQALELIELLQQLERQMITPDQMDVLLDQLMLLNDRAEFIIALLCLGAVVVLLRYCYKFLDIFF